MNLVARPNCAVLLSISFVVALALLGCNKDQAPVANNSPVVAGTPAGSPIIPPSAASVDDDNKVALRHGKDLAVGMALYESDNDSLFPLKEDWAEGVRKYVKMPDSFSSPHHPGVPIAYAYNAALSGVNEASITAPALVVTMFETTQNSPNPSDNGESWWMGTAGQLNATAFADGHIVLMDKKPEPKNFNPAN